MFHVVFHIGFVFRGMQTTKGKVRWPKNLPPMQNSAASLPLWTSYRAGKHPYGSDGLEVPLDLATLKSHVASLQVQLQAVSAELEESRRLKRDDAMNPQVPHQLNAFGRTNHGSGHSDGKIALTCCKEDCRYDGPASTAFGFEIARANLQSMGIIAQNGVEDRLRDLVLVGDDPDAKEFSHDLLTLLSKKEALRLCNMFAEDTNIMYPFLDMGKITDQVNTIFTPQSARIANNPQGDQKFLTSNFQIIVLVLAISLMIESNGKSSLARSLFHRVKSQLEREMWSPVSLSGIKALVLAARYYFYADEDDTQAWRIIGIAARQCLELGLHHTLAYAKMSNEDSSSARILFWSVFALDRRWSFGAGLPFTIQEEDIDPMLPEPDESYFYLKAMIPYCRISSKVWFSGFGTGEISKLRRDAMEMLDSQVLEWQQHLPEPLQCKDPYFSGVPISSKSQKLQLQMYVRTNIMRILIYRPVLYNPVNAAENSSQAALCVKLAKDTIQILHHIDETTSMYREQQTLFNFFVLSSLAVIFLACFHAPTEFCGCVQEEVSMALIFVERLNPKSRAGRRLWGAIKNLRAVGERIGVMQPAEPINNDDHSCTNSQDINLPLPESIAYSINDFNVPDSGVQMSAELNILLGDIGMFGSLPVDADQDGDGRAIHWQQTSFQQTSTPDELAGILCHLF
ncbi:putative transcriptional regulatory protein [Cladobotryum mycophilum]|uniref:Transcriptional regulatory protein n=1 Tax=Cladobotryum mycophilum TaxID=491253 RepID=A0ABR0SSP1_9HYPO